MSNLGQKTSALMGLQKPVPPQPPAQPMTPQAPQQPQPTTPQAPQQPQVNPKPQAPTDPDAYNGKISYQGRIIDVKDGVAVNMMGKKLHVSDDGSMVVNEMQQIIGHVEDGKFVKMDDKYMAELKKKGLVIDPKDALASKNPQE